MESGYTRTFLIDGKTLSDMKTFYADHLLPNPSAYVVFHAHIDGCTITVYQAKPSFKVVFQGQNAAYESGLWEKKPSRMLDFSHYGSDEVGTGDFLGPIVVAAAFVELKQFKDLRDWGVTDSKNISDDAIRTIAKKLIRTIPYSTVILPNDRFNLWTKKPLNMNEIKAILHNQVLLNVQKKVAIKAPIIIDQFADEAKYFSYLSKQKVVVKPIRFETKAESQFLAVGAASIIARYRFLLAMDALAQDVKTPLPFGASEAVEAFALQYAKRHGLEALKKICKTNFKTYQRIEKSLS